MKKGLKTALIILLLLSTTICRSQRSQVEMRIANLIGDESINLPESYTFQNALKFKVITQSTNPAKKKQEYILRFPTNGNFVEMISANKSTQNKKKPEVIVDFGRMQMITLLHTSEVQIAGVVPISPTIVIDRESVKAKYGNLFKSGKTKRIAGYTSEEFTFKTPRYSGSIWITFDASFGLSHSFNEMGIKIRPKDNPDSPIGVIMGIDCKEPKTRTQTKARVVSFKSIEPYAFHTSGFITTMLPPASAIHDQNAQ